LVYTNNISHTVFLRGEEGVVAKLAVTPTTRFGKTVLFGIFNDKNVVSWEKIPKHAHCETAVALRLSEFTRLTVLTILKRHNNAFDPKMVKPRSKEDRQKARSSAKAKQHWHKRGLASKKASKILLQLAAEDPERDADPGPSTTVSSVHYTGIYSFWRHFEFASVVRADSVFPRVVTRWWWVLLRAVRNRRPPIPHIPSE